MRFVAGNFSLAGRESARGKFFSFVSAQDQVKKYQQQSPSR